MGIKHPLDEFKEKQRLEVILLDNMRRQAATLQELLDRVNHVWVYEDYMYRFYYSSFKVYRLQEFTELLVAALKAIAPEGKAFCEYFQQMIRAGIGKTFIPEVNDRWFEETSPITHAFLHVRYFVEMAVKYSTLETAPQPMPSGWAALLCLFDIR